MGQERRKHSRVRPAGASSIACTAEDGRDLSPRLVDVSVRGACLQVRGALRPGEGVRVELRMPHLAAPFASRAVVRWSRALEGPAGQEERLVGLLFDAALALPEDKSGDPNALEILHVLRVAVAQLRLYPKDSPQVLKVANDAFHAIHGYLEQAGALTLSRTPRGLLVNGKPLTATGTVAESLSAATLALLAEVQIKSLTVKKGATLEELITFLHALTRKFWDVKEGKEINRRLREDRVFQISVDEVQYVALGEGDLVIEDAARKLAGGQSEAGRLLESLDRLIDSAAGEGLVSEARLHVLKKLLDQDPTLLQKAGKEIPSAVVAPDSKSEAKEEEEVGTIPFAKARDAVGVVVRLLQELPPAFRAPVRALGLLIAGAFEGNPKLQAVMASLLTEKAGEDLTELTQEAAAQQPAEPASIARGRQVLAMPDDQKVQVLIQEGAKLLEELAALDRKDLFAGLVGTATAALGERLARHRLAGGKAILGMRRVLERNAPEEVVGELEAQDRAALDQERDATVYPALAEVASFLADLRLRRASPEEAQRTLDLLNRHYHIKDAAFAQRAEQAYLALERVASGVGFSSIAEKVRAGDPEAVRILEALDAAATRFLIGEIRQADTNAKRLHFAQFIARAGTGAASVLVDEIQKTTSPSEVMRLVEVLPHAMPVDMAEMALGALIRHPAVAVRRRAATMMADLGYPRAGGLLLEAFLGEKDVATQIVCVECLGRLRFKTALEPLCAAADNRNLPDDLRGVICMSLGRIGDVRAVPVLVKLCSRGGWGGLTKIMRNVPTGVRASAVRALALFPTHPEAREALREAQEDKDAAVRFAAGQARLGPLFDAFGDPAQGAAMATSAADLRKAGSKVAGSLQEIPLEALFASLGASEAVGALLLNFKGPSARVYFDAGLVIAVEAGAKRDREAVADFAARKEGYFLFLPGEAAPDRRILTPAAALLAEARPPGA